jgi:EmrB/QacA subfamily drug resistance transporter
MAQHRLSSVEGRFVLAATILVSGMVDLLGRSVSIALPTIQTALATDITGIQWLVNAFGLVMAAFMLVSGAVSDGIGRKKVFCSGILIFLVGSVFAALAQNIVQLILAHAGMGLGAVLMLPACLSIINVVFSDSEKGRAIGLWAGLGGGFGVAGFLIGGWIIQEFGWRAIFLINVPIALTAIAIALRFVPESRAVDTMRPDWTGATWLAIGLLGISYALIQGPSTNWLAAPVVGSVAIGLAALARFVWMQRSTTNPLMPLHLFKNRTMAAANLMTFFLYFSLNGVYVFQVIYFQQQFGYTPLAAGAGMLIPSLMVTLFAGPAGTLTDRIGPRLPLIFGPLLTALGMSMLTLSDHEADYFMQFLPGLALIGAGMVIFVAPITKSALAVEQRYSGVASGIYNSVARISGLFAVAVIGAVMATAFASALGDLVAASSLAPSERQALLAQIDKVGGIEIPQEFGEAPAATARSIVEQSLTYAFRWAMGVNAAFALISAVIAWSMIRKSAPGVRAIGAGDAPIRPL